MDIMRFVTRVWFYFRMGYSTYVTFALGLFTTLVTIYYLAIKSAPEFLKLLPSFTFFVILGIVTGVPTCVGFGYLHFKRSQAWRSEVEIQAETNPYYYKVPKGYNREVMMPAFIEILQMLKTLMQENGKLTPVKKKRIERLERDFKLLSEGGTVGA